MQPDEELVVAEALQQLRGDSCLLSKVSRPLGDLRDRLPAWPGFSSEAAHRTSTTSPEVLPPISQPTGGGTVPGGAEMYSGPQSHAVVVTDNQSRSSPHQRPPVVGGWQGVLLSATSLLLSPETRKRLRQFVRMLRLANDHLSAKVAALKDAMDQESQGVEPKLSVGALRQDIISTIRKAMTVITTFAGSSLPETAKFAVRRCILTLPAHWASQMEAVDTCGAESAVLSLANEALVMIRDVTAIVDETLDRAESWCYSLGKHPREEDDEALKQKRDFNPRDPELPVLAPTYSHDSFMSTNLPATPN